MLNYKKYKYIYLNLMFILFKNDMVELGFCGKKKNSLLSITLIVFNLKISTT